MTEPDRPKAARFAALALWLGVVGFGGGFVVAQRMKHAVVDRRRWLSESEFLELFGVSTALPGTASANLVTILGHRFAGAAGALAATVLFLLPSIAVMIAFGAAYEHLRGITTLSRLFDGMSFATVGVVAAVAVDMGRAALKRKRDFTLAIASLVVIATHVLTLLEVVALSAAFGMVFMRPELARTSKPPPEDGFPPGSLPALAPALLAGFPVKLALFIVFARIGLVTFGGGFAMIPAIEREIVGARGWLDEASFSDAMVLGQITPGPVAIAATFIGYRVAGLAGALLATLGMFAPPWALTVVAGRSHAALRDNAVVQGALKGIAPAVVGVIAAAAVALFRTSVRDVLGAAVAAAAFVLLVLFRRLPPVLVLAAGGVVALIVRSR